MTHRTRQPAAAQAPLPVAGPDHVDQARRQGGLVRPRAGLLAGSVCIAALLSGGYVIQPGAAAQSGNAVQYALLPMLTELVAEQDQPRTSAAASMPALAPETFVYGGWDTPIDSPAERLLLEQLRDQGFTDQFAQRPDQDQLPGPRPGNLTVQPEPGRVEVEGQPDQGTLLTGSQVGIGVDGIDWRPVWQAVNQAVNQADLAQAQHLISALRQQHPDMILPKDLDTALAMLRLGQDIDSAGDSGNADRLIALTRTHPDLFRCPLPGNIWRLGDAMLKLKQSARMLPFYKEVVEDCPKPDDRFYAIERALKELPASDAELLLLIEKQRSAANTDPKRLAQFDLRLADRKFADAFAKGRLRVAREAALTARRPGPALQLGWRAYKDGDAVTAQRWFAHAIKWGGGDEARIGAATAALSRGRYDEAQNLLAHMHGHDKRIVALRRQLADARFEQALSGADIDAAAKLVMQSHDAARAARLGWAYLALDQRPEAAAWFDRSLGWAPGDEARIGATTVALADQNLTRARAMLAGIQENSPRADRLRVRVALLATRQLTTDGHYQQAQDLLDQQHPTVTRLDDSVLSAEYDTARASILLAETRSRFNAGQFRDASQLADRLVTEAGSADTAVLDAGRLIGSWAQYRQGDYAEAGRRFEALLDSSVGKSAAQGLALSLKQQGAMKQLGEMAESRGGELATQYKKARVEQAIDHGLVQTAALIAGDDDRPDGLLGIEAPWVQAGVSLRHTDGEAGQGRFLSAAPTFAIGMPLKKHRFAAMLSAPLVDAGKPQPGDAVGTPPPAAALASFKPTDDLLAIEPLLSWTYEDQLQPFASLGTTPLTGEVSPLPVGEIGVIYHGDSGWRASLTGSASSRRDSLLSLAGLDDPATGESYGRVVETGLRAQALVPLGSGFSLSGDAVTSWLSGKHVDTNRRQGIGVGLAYDLGLAGFEYFSLGPSYRYETYSDNENFYTFGHGGYFSPQSFNRAALDLNFQTAQFGDLLLRGTASVGYEIFSEDAELILPDQPSFGSFAANDSRGVSISGLIEGAYLLSPRWQLVGFAGGAAASDYDEYLAGLSLRYTFGARDGLVSRDFYPAQLGFSQR